MYAAAVFQLILAIGLGTVFSWLLTKTGLTFPIYIGAMIAAAGLARLEAMTPEEREALKAKRSFGVSPRWSLAGL